MEPALTEDELKAALHQCLLNIKSWSDQATLPIAGMQSKAVVLGMILAECDKAQKLCNEYDGITE